MFWGGKPVTNTSPEACGAEKLNWKQNHTERERLSFNTEECCLERCLGWATKMLQTEAVGAGDPSAVVETSFPHGVLQLSSPACLWVLSTGLRPWTRENSHLFDITVLTEAPSPHYV